MKKLFFICFSAILACTNLHAQALVGIRFFEGTYEQALARAAKENKIIFLDAYASWCGPCKAMVRNVFPNKELGDLYNANFINVKVDWESEEGSKLQAKYPIRVYPTLMFIDAKGNRIATVEGYNDAQNLVKRGEDVLKAVKK